MNKLLKKIMIPILLVIMILLSYMPKSVVTHAAPNEATLITGQELNSVIWNWNSGSATKVKNLVRADVPSDLMTATLRYKYETISTSDSPTKIYMWHDMNAYGQYTDTVYFGTEIPGATIYTNEDTSRLFTGTTIERIWDSANPNTPYFFNTSKSKDFSYMRLLPFTTQTGSKRVVDLLDVSNAEKLDGLFSNGNKELAVIGYDMSAVSTWNTSKVKSLRSLFASSTYYSVDFNTDIINNWDVHNVTDISGMYDVYGYTPLKMSWGNGFMNFDNLENISGLFQSSGYSSPLEINYDLNFTNWNFSKVDPNSWMSRNTAVFKGKVTVGNNACFSDGDTSILDNLFGSYIQVKNLTKVDNGNTYYLHNLPYELNSNPSGYRFYLGFDNSLIHQANSGAISLAGTYVANNKALNVLQVERWLNGSGSPFELFYPDSYVGTSYTLPTASSVLNPDPAFDRYSYKNKTLPWVLKSVSAESSYAVGTTFNAGSSIILPSQGNLSFTTSSIVKQINYDLDGGVNAPGNPTSYNGSNTLIQNPTKPGKTFMGWYLTTASGINKFVTDLPFAAEQYVNPPEDVNLLAIWGMEKTINVHGNGAIEYNLHLSDVTAKVYIPDNPVLPNGQDIPSQISAVTYLPVDTKNYGNINAGSVLFYFNGRYNYRATPSLYFQRTDGKVLTGISNTNVSGCKLFLDGPVTSTTRELKSDQCGGFDITKGNDLYLIWEDMQYMPQFDFSPAVSAYNPYDTIASTFSVPNYSGSNRKEIGTDFDRYWQFLSDAPSNGRYALGPNDHPTFSLKGYETGASDEFILDKYARAGYGGTIYGMITGFDVYMGNTKLASNVKTYTFSSGVTGKPRFVVYYTDDKFVEYKNLDGTEIEVYKYPSTGVVPYTYRNTYPPHGQYNGFDVMPVGWTLGKQYAGTDHEGVYVSTGSLPTLYRGTVADMNAAVSVKSLILYPMYSVDINRDGIPDLFQNKNTFTISKTIDSAYMDLTSAPSFTYNVFLGDVNGDPIKNWTITDTAGNSYTTDNSGIIHLTLHNGESISLNGMLPNMIVWAKETMTGGLIAEHQISYNGTAWVSGADSGNITYQDNTPLTVAFKNTDTRVIVPAGVIDNRTKKLTILMVITVLVGLAGFAIIKRVTDRLQM